MITLKPDQERVLDSLRDFFKECAWDGRPEGAFQAVQFNNGSSSPVPYIPVNAAGLSPRMPYVCLRVPTGGGKTLLACQGRARIHRAFGGGCVRCSTGSAR